jgi:hypothetical protein
LAKQLEALQQPLPQRFFFLQCFFFAAMSEAGNNKAATAAPPANMDRRDTGPLASEIARRSNS